MKRTNVVCRIALPGTAAIVALALGGCGAAHQQRTSEAAAQVTERDFHVAAPAHLHAGRVVLRVTNEGPDRHELIVVPSTPGGLPLRRDGLTVAEEAVESQEPGSLEPGAPGSVRDLTVNLAPGRYVFFCNMEGHFMGGMHAEVQVN